MAARATERMGATQSRSGSHAAQHDVRCDGDEFHQRLERQTGSRADPVFARSRRPSYTAVTEPRMTALGPEADRSARSCGVSLWWRSDLPFNNSAGFAQTVDFPPLGAERSVSAKEQVAKARRQIGGSDAAPHAVMLAAAPRGGRSSSARAEPWLRGPSSDMIAPSRKRARDCQPS